MNDKGKIMAKLNTLAQNNPVSQQDNPVLQGNFGPVDVEQVLERLNVVGEVPADLNGSLLRMGPNPVNPEPNHHWFQGDGMLHGIEFHNGQASSYRNKWVRTEALEQKLGLAAAPVSEARLMIQGSGNVNVVHHGGRVLALSEIGLPFEMGVETNTLRMFDYEGRLASNMTAHPKIDGETGEMLFFGYDLMPPFLKFHTANAAGELVRSVDIELPRAVMMHDFGVTASRVVFMDLPVVGDFGVMEQGFSMPFSWDDNHQSRLGVLDRDATSDTVHWIDIDPCYVFHPLNTYDDGHKIVMDVVKYNKMFTTPDDDSYEPGSNLVRWVIDPELNRVTETVISDVDQEFPRINPKVECHRHTFGYALETGGPQGFKGLLKYNFEAGTSTRYDVGTNKSAGEPVFVPYGAGEDEGYILSVVYCADSNLSEVHILDAHQFGEKPLAIVELGARVPFGFHGNFVPAE
ncbi:MAG: carotenoid cleavage dioxygenase [Patiriisocius sp.]